MFNFKKKYKKLIIAGVLFFFSAASVSAYVKKCCHTGKISAGHSCCADQVSFSYKQASKCECGISIPRDLVSEDKSDITNSILKHFESFARNSSTVNVLLEKNILRGNKSLFKSCSVPIFLKDCSFLI